MKNLHYFDNFILEKLGISNIVAKTSNFIYHKYLKNDFNQVYVKTSELPEPFNRIKELKIKKSNLDGNIKYEFYKMDNIVHIDQATIFFNQNKPEIMLGTLNHELHHLYQILIRNKKFHIHQSNNNLNSSLQYYLDPSEKSAIIATLYRWFLRKDIKNKNDFLRYFNNSDYVKRYKKIIDIGNNNQKKQAINMLKKIAKLYDIVINKNDIYNEPSKIKEKIEKENYFNVGDIVVYKKSLEPNIHSQKINFLLKNKQFKIIKTIMCDDIPECIEKYGKNRGQFIDIGYRLNSGKPGFFPSNYFFIKK